MIKEGFDIRFVLLCFFVVIFFLITFFSLLSIVFDMFAYLE